MKANSLCAAILVAACATPITALVLGDHKQEVLKNVNHTYMVEGKSDVGTLTTGSATAFKIEPSAHLYKLYLLTAKHVVNSLVTDCVVVYSMSGRFDDYEDTTGIRFYKMPFVVEQIHSTLDCAVISCIITNKIEVAEISLSIPAPLDPIYTLGFPFGEGLYYSEGKINYSILSKSLIVCSAATAYGCSGGGVYDLSSHKLIGVIVELGGQPGPFGWKPFWNVCKFVPLNKVEEILK